MQTISSIIYIADICEKHREKVKLFRKIVDNITNEVRYVKYFIEYIVDFSSKRSENDFIVRANVDSHLDKCKPISVSHNSNNDVNIILYYNFVFTNKNCNSWVEYA